MMDMQDLLPKFAQLTLNGGSVEIICKFALRSMIRKVVYVSSSGVEQDP